MSIEIQSKKANNLNDSFTKLINRSFETVPNGQYFNSVSNEISIQELNEKKISTKINVQKEENRIQIKVVNNHLVNNLFSHYENEEINKFELSKVNKMIEKAIHWCLVNGFVVVPKEIGIRDPISVTFIPFTLFPTPFKRNYYEQVMNLQPELNKLMFKIGTSSNLIERALNNLVNTDSFVSSLWNIYKKSVAIGYNQKINFSILRTDYMLSYKENVMNKTSQLMMKQVEINTIAAGFGYVSSKMTQLHNNILKWFNLSNMLTKLPVNEPLVRIAYGFVEAWRLYNVESSIVLFVVLDWEINIADQRHLEYEIIKQESKIEIHRCTLNEIYHHARLDQNKRLFFDDKEVSIVYYRAGYAPTHFETNQEWDALLKVEMSRAIKCPSLGTFLAGMKKIQEFIANEQVLNELCNNDIELIDAFKSVFAGFYSLNDEKVFEKVLKNPENFVIKPQREGGGNNFYKQQIRDLLTTMLSQKNFNKNYKYENDVFNRDRYVVMDFLHPFITENFIISSKSQNKRNQTDDEKILKKIKISNELGIYGVLVTNGDDVILNEACGYCLRSKPSEDNECGVMCGSGALDSIIFSD